MMCRLLPCRLSNATSFDFIRGAKSDILDDIVARKVLDADLEARLKDAILEFKKRL